jgi:mannan endo-1,4-beta-mannosidase
LPNSPKRGAASPPTYFADQQLKKKVFERTEPRVLLNTRSKPHSKVGADNFSVRWKGYVQFRSSEKHTICMESDDGARVFLGGRKIIDTWKKNGRSSECTDVRVRTGWFPLKVEYREHGGLAMARLKVGLDKRRARYVHPAVLCCKKK